MHRYVFANLRNDTPSFDITVSNLAEAVEFYGITRHLIIDTKFEIFPLSYKLTELSNKIDFIFYFIEDDQDFPLIYDKEDLDHLKNFVKPSGIVRLTHIISW